MKTFIITEEEKNRILKYHIERTKNLYLTEQSVQNLLDKGFVLSSDKKYFSIAHSLNGQTGIVKLFRTFDKPYQFEVNGVITQKGVWSWAKINNEFKVIFTATQTTSQPNWSKCLKNDNFYKDGDYNSSSGKFEFKEPITATGVVTNPLTVVKRDLNTFDENGVWNFTDSDGDILETGKWKCLPIIGTVINNPTDNFHISIKGVWYLKTSIPIDFNSIKEVNGEIVGKYGGKDAIWNDASNEWEVTNTGSQNTGSQNNSSTNNQNTNTTNNTSTGCRKLTTKKDKDFFNYKTPNDSKYLYGQDGGEWFALNTKNDKQFNVSKCYPNVISKLNNSVIKIRTISNNNSYITTSGEKSTSGIKVRPKQTPLSNSKIEGEDSLTNSGKYVDSKIGI